MSAAAGPALRRAPPPAAPEPRALHRRLPRPDGPASWCRGTSSTTSLSAADRAASALPVPGDVPRLHRARVPVRLRVRGRPPARPAVRARHRAARAPPALRARRRLLPPPAVPLALEDRREATPAEKAELFACNPLQLIAVSQLALLALQWVAGRRWVVAAAAAAVAILAAAPFVWAARLSTPPARSSWAPTSIRRRRRPSSPSFRSPPSCSRARVAGAWLGRTDRASRGGAAPCARPLVLAAAGLLLTLALRGPRRLLERLARLRAPAHGAAWCWCWPPSSGRPRAACRGVARPGPPRPRDAGRVRAAPAPALRRRARPFAAARPGGAARLRRGLRGARGDGARPLRRGLGLAPLQDAAARTAPSSPSRSSTVLVVLGVPDAPVVSALMPLLWLDALAEADRAARGGQGLGAGTDAPRGPARAGRVRRAGGRAGARGGRARGGLRPAGTRWPSARRRRRRTPRRRASPASSARSWTCAARRDVTRRRAPLPDRDRRRLRGADGGGRRVGRGSRSSSSSFVEPRCGRASSSPAIRAIAVASWSSSRTPGAARRSSPAPSAPAATCIDRATGEGAVRLRGRRGGAGRGRPARRRRLARRAEALFGEPQDVEWAIGADGPVLLQSRPITVESTADARPAHRASHPRQRRRGAARPRHAAHGVAAGGRARARVRGGRRGGPGSARREARPSSSSTASGCT